MELGGSVSPTGRAAQLQAQDFLSAGAMGGAGADEGRSVAVDSGGNVYTVGFFQGTVDFDPGPDTFNLTSAGGLDVFVSKLDSAGNFVWARSMGGAGTDVAHDVAVDSDGNVYTVGNFRGPADFDPGEGNFFLVGSAPCTDTGMEPNRRFRHRGAGRDGFEVEVTTRRTHMNNEVDRRHFLGLAGIGMVSAVAGPKTALASEKAPLKKEAVQNRGRRIGTTMFSRYGIPNDRDAFDRYYYGHHVQLAKTNQDVLSIILSDGDPIVKQQGPAKDRNASLHKVAFTTYPTLPAARVSLEYCRGDRDRGDH